MEKPEKKLIAHGEFENVYELEGHYYLEDLKDKICVLPFSMDSRGLLDKIGILEDWNVLEKERVITILNDYITTDDETDLLAANRILFDITGTNVANAEKWMFLGSLYSNMTSESPLQIYAVNITNVEIKENEEVKEDEKAKRFKMMDSAKVIQSDDILFLSAYTRLFQLMYTQSLNKK